MKIWLLFVFDLAVVVTTIRATYSAFHHRETVTNNGAQAHLVTETGGWIVAACLAAFAALIVSFT